MNKAATRYPLPAARKKGCRKRVNYPSNRHPREGGCRKTLRTPRSHALRGNAYRTSTQVNNQPEAPADSGKERFLHMRPDPYAFPRRAWERGFCDSLEGGGPRLAMDSRLCGNDGGGRNRLFKTFCDPLKSRIRLRFCGQRAAGSGQRSDKGFTLLELMVAIVLFSMISTAAYKLFMSVTRAQEVTQSVLDGLDKVQRAEIILEKDLFQMARRPVRDESGESLAALRLPGAGGALIEFTRSGWHNPLPTTRSTLQRVAYALEGTELIRYYWPMLDRAQDTPRIRQSVMSGVSNVKFRLLDDNKRWVNAWPPVQQFQANTSGDHLAQMPGAVEMSIVHETMGAMITVVPLITYKPDQADKEGEQDGNDQGYYRPDSPRQSPIEDFDGY